MRRSLRPCCAGVLALVPALAGCLSPERSEQEDASQATRASLGPSFLESDPPRESLSGRSPEADLEAQLASGPTLEVVREAALRRNPDLQVALERWVGFLERVPQRTSLPQPSVRYGYSSMFDMHTVEGMQEVPFPGKLLAEGRAALAEARAMRAEARERENVLRERSAVAYAGLFLARREVAIIDESLALLERFVTLTRSKYTTGAAKQSDVLRAEVERETLRGERAELARGVEVASSALNVLLDRAPDAPFGALAALAAPVTATGRVAPLERAIDARPELAAAVERADAADAMLSRANQEWLPDFVVGGAYVRDARGRADEYEATASITVPIWWGRIDAGIAEAEADARRARAELRSVRNRVLDEVRSAWSRTAGAAERFAILDREALPRAARNVEVSEAAYAAGQIDFLELIDAQRMLLMKRLERERALADHAMRRAELERAVGEGTGR